MHRSGATLRQRDKKLQHLLTQARTHFKKNNTAKSVDYTPASQLSEAALRGMGLSRQAFLAPSSGQDGYYIDSAIESLLQGLESSIQLSGQLTLLTGSTGSGKTCSVAQIVHSFYEQLQIFMARGGAAQSAEQIIRSMLGTYKSTTPTHVDECLEQLADCLDNGEEPAQGQLLILEDADRIDHRELQLLLNHLDHLNESLNGSLRLLFTSTVPATKLLEGLRSDQVNRDHVVEFCQPPLNEDQIIDYIDTRLLIAGSDRELPLDEGSLLSIYQATDGAPGKIDAAVAEALNEHFQGQQFKALLSPAHWAAATRLSHKSIALGGALLLTGLTMAFFSGDPSVERSTTTVREIAVPSANPSEQPLSTLAAKPIATETAALKSEPRAPAVAEPRQAEAPPMPKAAPAPVESAPKPVIARVIKPAKTAQEAVLTTTNPSNDFIAGVVSGHPWILRRDPQRFTAQLSAGWSEHDLRRFATRNGMTNKTAIYSIKRDGKDWFSLVHGDFRTPAEASAAVALLPKVWRKNGSWIRSFAEIQRILVPSP